MAWDYVGMAWDDVGMAWEDVGMAWDDVGMVLEWPGMMLEYIVLQGCAAQLTVSILLCVYYTNHVCVCVKTYDKCSLCSDITSNELRVLQSGYQRTVERRATSGHNSDIIELFANSSFSTLSRGKHCCATGEQRCCEVTFTLRTCSQF